MAGDNEIQILIKAVDEMSATLGNIDKNFSNFAQNNIKQTQTISQAWQQSTNTLIAVGNVAQSVDSIFSSLTNLELRLENATERLANAQDRLKDAQLNVADATEEQSKLQQEYDRVLAMHWENTKYGQSVIEDYEAANKKLERAKMEEERATRSLTIAENGLARAQNQVIGTYIQVGIQSVSLLKSLPMLISSISGFGGAAILAGGAIAGLTFLLKDNEVVQSALNQASEILKQVWIELEPVINQLLEALAPIIPPVLQLVSLLLGLAADILVPLLIPAIQVLAVVIKAVADVIDYLIIGIKVVVGWIQTLIDLAGKALGLLGGLGKGGGGNALQKMQTRKVGDAIIRPNGQIIETDPMDTIIATKNPGGISVYIDSVYGINPDQISRALKRELGTKISI